MTKNLAETMGAEPELFQTSWKDLMPEFLSKCRYRSWWCFHLICNIEDKHVRERFKDAQKKSRTPRAGAGSHLVEGAARNGWKRVLQQLAMAYPERTEPYLK